jgi:adenylate kinase family enzyme
VERVLVLGSGGAGKTTLSRKLAAATGLPLIHLDTMYWRPGWVRPSEAEWDAILEALLARDRWIMDGNYSRTVARRAEVADTIVFLDFPRVRCLIRALGRTTRLYGHAPDDLPDGCPERFEWSFVRWIWAYPKQYRPRIVAVFEDVRERGGAVVVLRNDDEVDSFLQVLTTKEETVRKQPDGEASFRADE